MIKYFIDAVHSVSGGNGGNSGRIIYAVSAVEADKKRGNHKKQSRNGDSCNKENSSKRRKTYLPMDDDAVQQSMTLSWKKTYKEQLINTKVARDDQ